MNHRDELELRYDTLPAKPRNVAAECRGRVRLWSRLAVDYARAARMHRQQAAEADSDRARDFHTNAHARALRNLAHARKCHGLFAVALGELIRPRVV